MKRSTKDSGIIIKQKAKEYFGIRKVIFILVISKMTKRMDLEFTSM